MLQEKDVQRFRSLLPRGSGSKSRAIPPLPLRGQIECIAALRPDVKQTRPAQEILDEICKKYNVPSRKANAISGWRNSYEKLLAEGNSEVIAISKELGLPIAPLTAEEAMRQLDEFVEQSGPAETTPTPDQSTDLFQDAA